MLKFNFFKPTKTIVVPEVTDASPAERAEQEKLTRRAALRRIGMAGGMAILGTLTIDDLARVSAKKLQENEVTRGIGESLAKEFKDAGIAIADTFDNDAEYYATGPKGVKPQQIIDAIEGCAKEHTPGSKAFYQCIGKKLGEDVYKNNFEYVWCQANDPQGKEGKCPGFPRYTPCDESNPVTYVTQSCCDAKLAMCYVKGGYVGGAACQTDYRMCLIESN